ncbi:calmodulin-binding protein 60 D-like isoform X2 [Typha angustifolia]|uniref:calmodulin-binding protein 60 D-like isoform X2 n=1 Tax=Typha angustifolia TaxID=59011 RepID=UPI003C2B4FD7
MAAKRLRPPPGEEEEEEDERSRPSKQFRSFRLEFTGNSFIRRALIQIEPMTRRVVREETQKLLLKHVNQVPRLLSGQNKCTRYQLQFRNKLNDPFYTFSKIEAKDRMLVQIAIIDKNLQKIITSDPYSSVTVEIVVLHSDFGDDRDYWNSEEFNGHIVPGREGKGPLLKGILEIQLVNGVADLTDVIFTDNSSWTKQKKFRLGVRISRFSPRGVIRDEVQEGISEPFRVKEQRVKGCKKHHPPSLSDKVWRLESISKDGPYCESLKNNGITTVEHFLKSYTKDEAQLRRMFGKKSSGSWEVLVKHAKECVLGDELYSYCIAEHNSLLFLNSIYQVVGAMIDGCYSPFDKLSPSQQASVEKWKRLAYQNTNSIHLNHKMINNHPVPLRMNDIMTIWHRIWADQVPMQIPQQQISLREEETPARLEESRCLQHDESSVEEWKRLAYPNMNDINIDHIMIGDEPRRQPCVSNLQIIHQVAVQVGQEQTSLPNNGTLHDLSPERDISKFIDVHPVGDCTSLSGASFDRGSSSTLHLNPAAIYTPEPVIFDRHFSCLQFSDEELHHTLQSGPQSQFNGTSEALPKYAYTSQDFASVQLSEIQTGSVNSCSSDDFVNGLLQTPEHEMSGLAPPLSPRRWGKIMLLLKWWLTVKRSAARRARFVPPSCQTLVPTI